MINNPAGILFHFKSRLCRQRMSESYAVTIPLTTLLELARSNNNNYVLPILSIKEVTFNFVVCFNENPSRRMLDYRRESLQPASNNN